MKNAIIFGVVIGILSGIWIWAMYVLGHSTFSTDSPYEATSILIPIIGLFFGVKRYRDVDKAGHITFFEGLQEGFKILFFGGFVAVVIAILFVTYVAKSSITDFSGKIFGALLVGVISALAVALLLMKGSKRIDH
ncbi:DUF4199 domain-containing protein [Mucilaginibacter sp.]|uniref:DUF4199 domain-containing protein n=1 Tax=Mucilaginibacter sp. TaxID=1882438 RepID=UPI003AFF96A3